MDSFTDDPAWPLYVIAVIAGATVLAAVLGSVWLHRPYREPRPPIPKPRTIDWTNGLPDE